MPHLELTVYESNATGRDTSYADVTGLSGATHLRLYGGIDFINESTSYTALFKIINRDASEEVIKVPPNATGNECYRLEIPEGTYLTILGGAKIRVASLSGTVDWRVVATGVAVS